MSIQPRMVLIKNLISLNRLSLVVEGVESETPLAKAQGVLANVPALLLFLDGNVALDGRSQGF